MINVTDFTTQIQGLDNLVQQTVNQFVVRPPGSAGSIGISGFLFDVLDREEMMFESDITDSYVEDNTAVQDHIALKPERFTLRGYVGELSDHPDEALQQFLFVGTTLQNIAALLPGLTIQANQSFQSLQVLESSASQALLQGENLYQLFSQGNTSSEKQQNAFQYFYSLWLSRQFCTVETPYKIFSNMAIESVRAIQNGDTKTISEFTVTFKMIRTTSTIVSAAVPATAATVANNSTSFGGASGSWPASNSEVTSANSTSSVAPWVNMAVNPSQSGPLTAESVGEQAGQLIFNSFNPETQGNKS